MAGHSKWKQIKRQKAVVDQRRGAQFTKLGREITLDYRIEELDEPRRIRLVGSAGRTFDGWDQMTLVPAPAGGPTARLDPAPSDRSSPRTGRARNGQNAAM